MTGAPTYSGLERISHMPDRADPQGDRIAGQLFNDVYFTGGYIGPNVVIDDQTNSIYVFASTWPGVTVGTGQSTATQTATLIALQEAVNYAYNNQKIFFLDPGTYEIYGSTGLTIPETQTGFVWVGFRSASILKQFYDNAPILRAGTLGSSGQVSKGYYINGVTVQYANDQTGNTNANAVVLGSMWKSVITQIESPATYNGASGRTVAPYRNLYITNDGQTNASFFSNTIDNCSFRGGRQNVIYIKNNGTGNVFSNLYCAVGAAPYAESCTGPVINVTSGGGAFYDSNWSQINIEWAKCQRPLYLDNCRGMNFQSIHFEGNQLTGNNSALVYEILGFNSFSAINSLNTRILTANGATNPAHIFLSYRDSTSVINGCTVLWDNQGSPQVDIGWRVMGQESDNIATLASTWTLNGLTVSDNQSGAGAYANMSMSNYFVSSNYAGYKIGRVASYTQGGIAPSMRGMTIDLTTASQTVYGAFLVDSVIRTPAAPGATQTVTLSNYLTDSNGNQQYVKVPVGATNKVCRNRATADANTTNIVNWDGTLIVALTTASQTANVVFNGIDWQLASNPISLTPVRAVTFTPSGLNSGYSGMTFTNEGATQKIEFVLPTAPSNDFLSFRFVVQDADGIRVTAATGDTIRNVASVSSVAGYIESTTVGSILQIWNINATEWYCQTVGTWTTA